MIITCKFTPHSSRWNYLFTVPDHCSNNKILTYVAVKILKYE